MEREPERKVQENVRECSYNKPHVHLCVEAKVETKTYVGEVDPIKMSQWLQ